MNRLLLELANTRQTYRKMLNLYWLTLVLTIMLEYFIHRVYGAEEVTELVGTLSLQALVLAAVTGMTELLYRYRKVPSDDLMIITGIFYASSIIYVNPTIGIVPAIYILPILTSVLSFNKSRILPSLTLVLACFASLYGLSPELRISMQPVHLVGLLFLFLGVAVIALNICISGNELLNNLKNATEAKQELLVKTVIMDKLAKMDALTDLYNHKTFHEYLEKLIEQNERNGLSLQLAIMDIDNFKKINDTYGHWVGDIMLQRVARNIKNTVTPDDIAVRYGGEEFAVIFTEKTIDQSFRIVEQIRQQLAAAPQPELDSQAVTLSIGLHDYASGEGKESMFKGADASLYAAKRTGKNKTVVQALRSDHKGA